VEKKITRTFQFSKVEIKDAKTGDVLETQTLAGKVSREKIAIAFIKKTKNTSFTIEITETEELREMSLETFIANSTVVVPKETPAPTV
jgi:hypothetical protein